jgi:hypothetical protein
VSAVNSWLTALQKSGGKFKPVWIEIEQMTEQMSLYDAPPCGELVNKSKFLAKDDDEERGDCGGRKTLTTLSLRDVSVTTQAAKEKEMYHAVSLKVKVGPSRE